MSQYSGNTFYHVDNQGEQFSNYFQFFDQNSMQFKGQRRNDEIQNGLLLQENISEKQQKLLQTKDYQGTLSGVRQIRTIQISFSKKIQFLQIVKGTKNQTVQLNTNYKTILLNYMKELIYARLLNDKQYQIVNAYKQKVPSFQAILNSFFENQGSQSLRKKICKLLGSTHVVKKILRSKASQISKIKMLKFLQILRLNFQGNGQAIKWKSHKRPKFTN